MGESAATPKLRYSVAVISAASLSYEILLMRFFSIVQWHHFAYMIISLALLGYGVSGTFLAIARERLASRFPEVYVLNLLLFGVAAFGCYAMAQQLPFNAEEVLWDGRQFLYLMAIYTLLFLPFFFAASAIGLALSQTPSQTARIYAADLLGAGIGCLLIILLLFFLYPKGALKAVAGLGLAAALFALWEFRVVERRRWIFCVLVGGVPLIALSPWLEPEISPYKGLAQLLRVPGTSVVEERSSPLGWISVVKSEKTPLRYAPGLSLNATEEPPPQLGVFTDADGMTAITRFTGDRSAMAYLDQSTSALPYHLQSPKRALLLGAGAGSDVLQALYHGAERIDAVELNPQIVDLVKRRYKEFAGSIYDNERVTLHLGEARGFVARSKEHYDLIHLALLDSFGAASAGLYALSENYLYTVEALREYLRHLAPDGYLAVTRWIKVPPRDALKLFATALAAIESGGAQEQRLVLIRSWQTSTLLVKNGAFTAQEIDRLKRFCDERGFDTEYYPGIEKTEANRYNQLQEPYFYIGTQALLGDGREAFFRDYKFDVRPATDDKPYFFHFFKWSVLPEILKLRGRGGMPLLESGYLVLVATLLQAVLSSVVLILLPLLFSRQSALKRSSSWLRGKVLFYFVAIGLAFLFVEIAFIQKFILFLAHPLYAVTIVLSAFLLFAGIGSAWSNRYRYAERKAAAGAVAVIAAAGLFYMAGIDRIFEKLLWLPDAARIVIAVVLVAPLGFFMGMPFPLAMQRLGRDAPALIPWAWGINGCASVIGAVLATLIAMHLGFGLLLLIAVLLYGLSVLSFPADR